jgi:hypothetical protein
MGTARDRRLCRVRRHGARSITVGAVSASSGGPTDYPAEREAILASLLADVWTFA